MKNKLHCVIHCINISKHISNHLVGQKHTHIHRKIVGATIMLLGGAIAKFLAHAVPGAFELFVDVIGYGIHGVGLIPFVEKFENS